MERTPVTSSNIKSVGYESDTLEIEFSDGGVYRYSSVPQAVYEGLVQAESVGRYFLKNIKNEFQCSKE